MINVNNEVFHGVQIAGVTNLNRDTLEGLQVSGVNNISGDIIGGQVTGVSNFAEEVNGTQIAGVMNLANKHLDGFQLSGVCNSAQTVDGIQISGILNKTHELNGVQLGLVNVVDSVGLGFQLGLFNIVKNGYRSFEFTTSDYYALDFNYKTGGDKLYSVLNVGINREEVGLGYGLGIIKPLYKGLSTSIEGVSAAIFDGNNSVSNTLYVGQKSSVKLALNFDFFKHCGITTGLTWNHFKPSTYDDENINSSNLIFVKDSRILVSESIASGINTMWFGAFVGIRL